jgi:hypothetical protein
MVSDDIVGVIPASGNDGFYQSTDAFFPEIEKLRTSMTKGIKFHNFFCVANGSHGFFTEG